MNRKIETIYWHITRLCNLQCSYCYFSAGRRDPDELTESELFGIANDMFLLKPARIVFTGGEPLLHENLINLSSFLVKKLPDSKICLNTNGIIISSENAEIISNIFHEVRISVDSFENVNDEFRGKGSFQKALNAYMILHRLSTIPRIFITVNSKNINHLPRFLEYLIKKNIANIHISSLKLIGRANNKDLIPTDEELNKVVENYWWNKFGLKMKTKSSSCTNCGLGSFLTINPNGDVFPCHALSSYQFRIGNLRQKRLQEVLEGSKFFNRLSNLDLRSKNDKSIISNSDVQQHEKCLAFSPDFEKIVDLAFKIN